MTYKRPLIIVGALKKKRRQDVLKTLLHIKAPVIAEAVSGLREEPRLKKLLVESYQPDALVKVGGIPTAKIWRDLEVSPIPLLTLDQLKKFPPFEFQTTPLLEPSNHLFHALSLSIPKGSLVYLGNSTPIRLWNSYATRVDRGFEVQANLGLNGIDGQISTFLGRAEQKRNNVAIVGDLTLLYDLAAFWILKQMKEIAITVIVINNGGGQIFKSKFKEEIFLNKHSLNFQSIANFWGLDYERCEKIPKIDTGSKHRLIEIIESNKNDTRDLHQSLSVVKKRVDESVSSPPTTSCAL